VEQVHEESIMTLMITDTLAGNSQSMALRRAAQQSRTGDCCIRPLGAI